MIGKIFAFIAGFFMGTIFGAFALAWFWEWLITTRGGLI